MAAGWEMIPHNRPHITAEDRAAVDAVLRSGWVAQGLQVELLETEFIRRYESGGACAVSSGTSALFLALKALGIKAGAEVAVPTYSCAALLNAVYMVGAKPIIVDILPDSLCMDPIALNRQAGDADCVIAVHTFGAAADMGGLRKPERKIIEDCCQTSAGDVGLGQLGMDGDAAVFSFYATKIITGGQGGLVWSKKTAVTEAIRDYRQFDCRDSYYPRFNLQMTDFQAALINSQMRRLNAIRDKRQYISKCYLNALPNGLSVQSGLTDIGRMVHRFVVLAPDLATRDALKKDMERAGVGCVVPIERYELLHQYLKLEISEYPVAERIVDTSLSLPIHSGLSDAQITQIANALHKFNP